MENFSEIRGRSALCKICNALDETTLNEITLDLILSRRSWKEIKEVYNKKLPPGVTLLSDINLNHHKKHSDPLRVVGKVLQSRDDYKTNTEEITTLFSERFKKDIDKKIILKEIYRERINNLYILQSQLEEKKKELDIENRLGEFINTKMERKKILRDIQLLIRDIDSIHDSLQQVVLKDMNREDGIPESNTSITINNNTINIFSRNLKEFMRDIVNVMMIEEFKGDPDSGKRIVSLIGKTLDKHVKPVFAEFTVEK